ncbi:MAG: hypothetical protein HQ567_21620 [Candidatus Nealsonbacteria bacterium]|nr:hypothetical protein [Candidatus Nealsonbacteria bacterium]
MASKLLFFDKIHILEQVLDRYNGSPQALVELEDMLRDTDVRREFFRKLDRADWIAPLRNSGFFAHPPETSQNADSGVQYSIWSESKYLVRMASRAPSEVADVLAEVEADNPSVIADIIHAALAMPAEIATKLVPKIGQAAQDGTLWIHFADASDLCVRLAEESEVDAALDLADALYTPTFEKGEEEPRRRDEYWYREGLKKVAPLLIVRTPQVFLRKLCDWLKASVDAKKQVDEKTGNDYSYTWRPAIEEHGQNGDYDFAGAMVGIVREGFEQAVNGGQLSLDEALTIVEDYTYLVFKRLRLHLINEFAEQRADLARREILDRELFDSYQFKHEYAMLVGRRLNVLRPEEKTIWFQWIDDGPDMSNFDESIKGNLGRDATDEDRQGRIHYWQFEKLHWVREHLQGERRKFYERMLGEEGEPKLADLNVYTESGWGSQSPVAVDGLSGMTFEQAVETVSSWRPKERGFRTPDIEGLASTFKQYVGSKPEAFSSLSHLLRGRPAIYVRGFIDQMGKAVAADREIDIPAVLDLCKWVVDRPVEERTTPEVERDALVDKDWQWSRNEISGFVEIICKAKSEDAPRYSLHEYREPIWALLDQLCRDPEESCIVHDVSQVDPRGHDYVDDGINSPRGQAVRTALEYADWVGNHLKKVDGKQGVIPGGFDVMPEIRKMLQWQIAPQNRSVEAMSVIGMRIGVIYRIDKQWLAANADQLFDLKAIEQEPPVAHGWAAWNAFLVWGQPYIEFYRLFQSQFAYAVEQAATVQLTEESDGEGEPMNHLGEHLMVLYGYGQLGLDDDGGLLRRFFANSNPYVRRHAIGFIGQRLEGDKKVPAEVVERFMELWTVYWGSEGKKDAEESPDSWFFGEWFSSGQFPEQWAMEQLEQFVEVVPIFQHDYAVVEQLAKIAQHNPARSVRILDRMARGDREGWRIGGWIDDARKILDTAMKAGDEARAVAVELINYLGRRGYAKLGELLR